MSLENYHTLFILFLIITIVLGIALIVMFFLFDIWKIIRIKTGWAMKESIKEMNEINQQNDTKKRKKYKGHSVSFHPSSEEIKEDEDTTYNLKLKLELEDQEETIVLHSEEQKTDVLDEKDGTIVLQENQPIQDEEKFFQIVDAKTIIFSEGII